MSARRRQGSRTAMFLRILMRATLVRRGRALAALTAVIVASAVATAMLDLYADLEAKLRKEFRSYGANLVVVAGNGSSLPADALARVDAVLAGQGTAVPFAYAVARTSDGQPVVIAGTDFARVRRLDTWWKVTGWPEAPNTALVGTRARAKVAPDQKPFTLSYQGKTVQLLPAGSVSTGAAEDSRVFLDLGQFTNWTGVLPSSIEVGVTGSAEDVAAAARRISASLPGVEVRPVRQIVEAEAHVLNKTRASLFAAAVVIILTATLCMLATLTASVLDRRRDFAVMKALGASERLISAFFAAEAMIIGVLGSVAGFGIGVGVAAWIGRANFNAAVAPRISVFPAVLAGSVVVALLSAALPLTLLRRVQPATILRGE